MHAGHAPSAAEGQLAAHLPQTNEQLEALCLQCKTIHEATTKAVAECDASHRANLKLRSESLTTTLGLLSFPTFSGMESGLMIQASPQLGRGISGLSTLCVSPFPPVGRVAIAYFARPVIGPTGSTPFPSPRIGSGGSHVLPGLYMGKFSMTTGQF